MKYTAKINRSFLFGDFGILSWSKFAIFLGILISAIVYISDSLLAVFGAFLVVILFIIGLVKPLWIVYFSLASGGFALAALTDYQRSLFTSLGGIHLDGLRLVGIVVVLGTIAVFKNYFLKRKSLLIYFVFLLFAGFSLLYSNSKLDGLRLFFKLCFPYFIFITIINSNIKNEKLQQLQKAIFIGGLVVILLSLFFILFGIGFITLPGDIPRLRSTIGGAANLSFYLGLIGLYCYAKFIFQNKKEYFLVFLLSFIICIFTITRIGIAAMLIGTLVLTLLARKKFFAVLILSGSIIVILFTPVRNRLFYFPVENINEIFSWDILRRINTQGRENIWRFVLPLFYNKPIFGAGLGSTTKYLLENFDGPGVVHNEYLRILVETGIIGFSLFMLSYLIVFRRCISIFKISKKERFLSALAIAGLVFYFIINITDNGIDYYANAAQYAWAYVALCFVNFKNQQFEV